MNNCILQQLPSGRPRLDDLAQELGISRSKLQRRLGEEKLTFRALLEEVRYRLADEYVGGTSLPLSEVALLLGFSDQGNFTHSFKRWFGVTPRTYRLRSA